MSTSFEEIVARLEVAAKRPYLVAIDGRSGAGKSVFAERLSEKLPNDIVVIHKDDFYRKMEESDRAALNAEQGFYQYFDWQRLEREVLAPLFAGQAANYRRYDWVKKDLAETIAVDPQRIIVVEGVGSTRPELREYYDFRIWVETSEAERLWRQLARTWDSIEWIRRWGAAEAYYVETFQPMTAADAVVAGE